MPNAQVNARPETVDKVCELMIETGSPGYLELDGTAYRVIHLADYSGLPPYLAQYKGAIAEWLPGHEDANVTLYTDEEQFAAHFANIDIVAHKV